MTRRGPDRTGRPYMTGDRDPAMFPPVYQFVRSISTGRDKAIPVILTTQDPCFSLSGKAEIMGFDPETMDRAVLEMIRAERRIAYLAFYYIQSQPNLLEKAMAGMRRDAQELAVRMQDIREEMDVADAADAADADEKLVLGEELKAADERFNRLVLSSLLYPAAVTMENPYLLAFLRTGALNSIKQMTFDVASRCCHHVEIRAEITDKKWLASPIYQDEEGFTVPKMEIREVTAIPMHEDYRDALPHKCRGLYGLQHHVGQGKEMYTKWEGREEATLLSRRKSSRNS